MLLGVGVIVGVGVMVGVGVGVLVGAVVLVGMAVSGGRGVQVGHGGKVWVGAGRSGGWLLRRRLVARVIRGERSGGLSGTTREPCLRTRRGVLHSGIQL